MAHITYSSVTPIISHHVILGRRDLLLKLKNYETLLTPSKIQKQPLGGVPWKFSVQLEAILKFECALTSLNNLEIMFILDVS